MKPNPDVMTTLENKVGTQNRDDEMIPKTTKLRQLQQCKVPHKRRQPEGISTLKTRILQSRICPAPCVLLQCRLFCLCMYGQYRVCYIHHVEFHFRFRRLVSFPV